jgi:hypothetical protein
MMLDEKQIIDVAHKWLKEILPNGMNGRFFLAGGAFKSVVHGEHPYDLDLWPTSPNDRKMLLEVLYSSGSQLIRDNDPYQTVLYINGHHVEIVYSVTPTKLEERLCKFDLAMSAIGIEYDRGTISCCIHPLAHQSVNRKEILLLKPLINWKYALVTLERMRRYAKELEFNSPKHEEAEIWSIFRSQPIDVQQGMIERYQKVARGGYKVMEEALCHIHR